MEKVRIILLDDHHIVREGFSALLQGESFIELVGTGANGLDGLRLLGLFHVEVALVDIDMPEMNGIEFTKQALEAYPDLKIIMLTMHEERAMMQHMIALGAKGYLLKTIDQEELRFAIKQVAKGKNYYSNELAENPKSTTPPMDTETEEVLLSTRELEILRLVAEGNANKTIADQLNISPRTVDTHRNNVMKKLDLHNAAGLVRYAFKHGIIK